MGATRRSRWQTVIAVLLVGSSPSWGQVPEPSPPPPPPSDVVQPAPVAPVMGVPESAPVPVASQNPTYLQHCFGYPSTAYVYTPVRAVYFPSVAGPGPTTTAAKPASSSSGSSGGGGGGDGKGLLVLAVLIVAALPFFIYAVDSDAPAVVEQRFHCPSFTFEGGMGVQAAGNAPSTLFGAGRFGFGYGYVGADFEFDTGVQGSLATHLIARIGPKNHIEPSIAVGYHHMALGNATRDGVEVGIPHRYVLWRDDLRALALELRPALTFGGAGVDASLEAAILIPLLEMLQLRAGGKVSSFGNTLLWSGNGGISVSL